MKEKITHAVEDYLKTIYDLSDTHERATTNQIAEVLEVAPASVTGMIKRLAALRPPMVEYRKHHGVVLTSEGEEIALEIIRHHRLLETFLHQSLGYDWDTIHAEADRLEHVISEQFEERIAQALGDPTHDPHGDPIPDKNLNMPLHATTHLMDMRPGQEAIIQRVRDDNPELLRFLSERGIKPGVNVRVVDYSAFDDNLYLDIEGNAEPLVLGPRVTRQIFVEITK